MILHRNVSSLVVFLAIYDHSYYCVQVVYPNKFNILFILTIYSNNLISALFFNLVMCVLLVSFKLSKHLYRILEECICFQIS